MLGNLNFDNKVVGFSTSEKLVCREMQRLSNLWLNPIKGFSFRLFLDKKICLLTAVKGYQTKLLIIKFFDINEHFHASAKT